MNTHSDPYPTTIPIYAVSNLSGSSPARGEIFARRPEESGNEGLLHDARNLMGAIGLYCDLLSMPGVLRLEHRQYADELRLLGARSGALIERLLHSALVHNVERQSRTTGTGWEAESSPCDNLAQIGRTSSNVETLRKVEDTGNIDPLQDGASTGASELASGIISSTLPAPRSMRSILERCAGLLSRVAGGRVIELSFGDAASAPISVDEEAIERILVNLVRNAATALRATDRSGDYDSNDNAADSNLPDDTGAVLRCTPDPTADVTPGAIRIGVGFVINRTSDPKPWPIRRVRLTVEDSGCGMTPQQLERILYGTRSPLRGSHGIGFRVVRELVASTGGDLRAMSAPGIGTRVQIEWPVAASTCEEIATEVSECSKQLPRRPLTDSQVIASSMLQQERRGLSENWHEMHSATTEESALASPDIVLSDSCTIPVPLKGV
jgi:signal transduction histidine kinase